MNLIDGIIFYCLKQLNGERTIYSIYHLLKGKKSSQTIQDAHLYELTKYFGVYDPITREVLEQFIQTATANNWIEKIGDQRFILTNPGKVELENFWRSKYSSFRHLNGWKFQHATVFWERLTLFVQVISNIVNGETRYHPIQKDKGIQHWMKAFLAKNRLSRQVIGQSLYSELVNCLERAEDVNPTLLVYRLTGFNRIGMTSTQVSGQLGMEDSQYHIEFLSILYYMMDQLSKNPSHFPLLSALVADLDHDFSLTDSSMKTLSMVKEGYSLEEIANRRGLKRNTIEDHIVEIALNVDRFSIDQYIDKQTQAKIIAIAKREDTRKLKQIRNAIKSVNYFEIRLVLAKYGAEKC